ncbi:MAG: hypothetical protein M3041_02600 [Acidobacteriota bacterium]|nr:hypothetical protein [Acidobacteriota bacterium]
MRRTAFLFLLLMVAPAQSMFAGLNRWTLLGPAGGDVSEIIVSPADNQILYAAVSGTVYKSEDAASTWRRLDLADPAVFWLAISPSAGTLYAASTSKVWLSSDGGEHWRNITAGGGNTIALAATADRAILLTRQSVSVFNGVNTWESASFDMYDRPEGLPFYQWNQLAASQDGSVIVSAPGFKFITTDGFNWKPVQQSGELIDFGADGALYIMDRPRGALIVHKSVDGGRTWRDITLVCDGCDQASLYVSKLHVAANGRVYISKRLPDGRWFLEEYDDARLVASQEMTGSPAGVITSARDTGRIYAGTWVRGIFALEDGKWSAANTGLGGTPMSDIAVAPRDASLLYAASDAGALRSADGGKTWEGLDARGTHVAVDPNASNVAYLTGVACRIYYCPPDVRLPVNVGLKKSTDSGRTWTVVRPQVAYAAAVAPSDSSVVYAALADGMARSSDAGATWTSINSGLHLTEDERYYGDFDTAAAVVDPRDASVAYIGRPDGLFKTEDGATWSHVASAPWYLTMAIDSSDSHRMYRGAGKPWLSERGIFVSDDGGVSWRAGGLADEIVNALAISAAQPHTIYAGTESGNVYRSNDRAESWERFDDGLPHGAVRALSMDASGRFLFVATDRGVYGYESGIEVVPLADGPRLDEVVRASVVIPIAGSTHGANGTRWSSDLAVRNNASRDQDVAIAWLSQSDAGAVSSFAFKVPAGQQVELPNIVDKLEATGTGSMLLFGESLDASVRICSHREDRSPICESTPSIPTAGLADTAAMHVAGLRHDAKFRSSVGIVNLDASWHAFHVTIAGERQSSAFDVFVPPYRSSRTWLTDGDFGSLTVSVTSIGSPSRWLAYGSTVDNASDAGTTVLGTRR